jgi:hypothetical protein
MGLYRSKAVQVMWSGFDAELWKELETIRELVSLTRLSPTKEWPLALVADLDGLLVVREWPGGKLTAYLAPTQSAERKTDEAIE